jgi:hypothetical protein
VQTGKQREGNALDGPDDDLGHQQQDSIRRRVQAERDRTQDNADQEVVGSSAGEERDPFPEDVRPEAEELAEAGTGHSPARSPGARQPERGGSNDRVGQQLTHEAPHAEPGECHRHADGATRERGDETAEGELLKRQLPFQQGLRDAGERREDERERQHSKHRGQLRLVEQRTQQASTRRHEQGEPDAGGVVRPKRGVEVAWRQLLALNHGLAETRLH